jgi:squalene-hopene/tetraprenyl-beta-curcumene cyclase
VNTPTTDSSRSGTSASPDRGASELLRRSIDALLAARSAGGAWEGHLSSSALSTATAVTALALHLRAGRSSDADARLIDEGLAWVMGNRNRDGGWGDTVSSVSNISTTLLVWSALAFAPPDDRVREAAGGAEAWLARAAGSLEPRRLAAAVTARYGRDRTFSVPILTMCALAGRLGHGSDAWHVIPALPFELAAAPRRLFAIMRLPVVSYALPALIALGLARHRRRPTRNPIARLVRQAATPRVLRVLDTLQPPHGGFLDATPLTSFVAMSLVAAGEPDQLVVRRALSFIRGSVRPDGSWPIDTHLSTWGTTLAVNALHDAGALAELPGSELASIRDWLLAQQNVREHVYTGAAPGGWAWTPLPGGVPDADDTAGALLSLAWLPRDERSDEAAARGVEWLLGLQNRDGGIPTFCRGWGALPFDRSGADLTAHAIRAWLAWRDRLVPALRARVDRATGRAIDYLRRTQRANGSFVPLWFGNEAAPGEENPVLGTARVIAALAVVDGRERSEAAPMLAAASDWLLAVRNADGGWGGDRGVASSIEETALAIGALSVAGRSDAGAAIAAGCEWLRSATLDGRRFPTAPIGLYFARLWYSEMLYPLLFTVSGLAGLGSPRSARAV